MPSAVSRAVRRATGRVAFNVRALPERRELAYVRRESSAVRCAGRELFATKEVLEMSTNVQAYQCTGEMTTLGILAASIAHEVNQPLSGILTNAGTCLRMLDATAPNLDSVREVARRMIRDARRAGEVVRKLHALFSTQRFQAEPLDLNETARTVIALSAGDLRRNGVIVQSELADALPIVRGDRIQLQQVILNLLRNAMDAMVDVYDRPRHLLIRTEMEPRDGLRLTVRDVGVGFAAENLDAIFEAFHTTKSGGMGIGLFVSRSIIERHGGRLWATLNDGPGATFSFSIPCEASPT